MIQSNELRVGNWVQDNNGFIFTVVSIHDDGTVYCDFEGNEGDVWEFDKNNPCEPIRLTEKILLKCGFVKFGKLHDSYIMNPFIIEIGILGNKYCFRKIINKEESYMIKEIKHLHQLQNLYFALCNEELNVKL